MIKFFNTLSGKTEPFHSINPGEVKLYTCGPTVYDYAHIGNLRAYVFEDLLKRFLMYADYKVSHVMNITDVDDKTIKGANAAGLSLQEYTKKYINSFFHDIRALNISKAHHYPLATEHIPDMVLLIQDLIEKGYAYRKAGSVYFNISKFQDYGKLSKIDLKELKPGQRVDSDEYEKVSLHDFALWKMKKEGEPYWDTKIGPGRPGWHIECSVMSAKYLGQTFDIHCGGIDNIFPHHENEIAQSEASTGEKFVNYWLHCHHLIVDGEKMSKSKGNYYTLKDILEKEFDPASLRFLLLSTHYRKMLNFTFDALNQASASIQRIKDFLFELQSRPLKEGQNKIIPKMISEMKQKFVDGLSNDLNISEALTALFAMIKKAHILISQEKVFKKDAERLINAITSIDKVLAILPKKEKKELAAENLKKIQERQKARENKDFAKADRIRDELFKKGIILEDTKDGRVRWKILN